MTEYVNTAQKVVELQEEIERQASEIERLERVEKAAKTLHHFLWNEKQTTSPPDELISAECVACESIEDYEREEVLTMELGEALGIDPDDVSAALNEKEPDGG